MISSLSRSPTIAALQAVPLPIWVLSKEGETLHVSAEFRDMFGYAQSDIPTLQAWWEKAMPNPVQRAELAKRWDEIVPHKFGALLPQQPVQPLSWLVCCATGQYRHADVSVAVLDDLLIVSVRERPDYSKIVASLGEMTNDFRKVFDHSNAGVIILDNAGDIIEANQAFAQLIGSERSKLIGINMAKFTHPDDLEFEIKRYWEFIAGKRVASRIEKRYLTSQKEIVWIDSVVAAIRDDTGKLSKFLAVVVDISERKRIESELMASEERYRVLFEDAVEAQIILSPESHHILAANPVAKALLGSHHMSSRPMIEFFDQQGVHDKAEPGLAQEMAHRTVLEALLEEVEIQGKCEAEVWLKNAQGKRFPAQIKLNWLKTGKGSVVHARIFDITQVKKSARQQSLINNVFLYSREGIAIVSPSQGIREVNPAFLKMLYTDETAVLGASLASVLQYDDDTGIFSVDFWDELIRQKHWQGELTGTRGHGEPFTFSVSAGVIGVDDDSSGAYSYVFILSDITEQKNHEKNLERLAHHDVLTGLPNRAYFMQTLRKALESPAKPSHVSPTTTLAVLYIDLDGFKTINDKMGHQLGDVVLQQAAKQMKRALRDSDVLARVGGDEFVAIVYDLDLKTGIHFVLERLLEAASVTIEHEGIVLGVSASIGVSIGKRAQGAKAEDVLHEADVAMYEAKKTGKNRFVYYRAAAAAQSPQKKMLDVSREYFLK